VGSAMSDQRLTGGLVVTGGGSGIGRAAVLAGAERGAGVAVLDIDHDAAQRVAAQARKQGTAAVGIACGVRDEASVTAAIATAANEIGPLQMLVTSAGIDRGGLVHELPVERWNDVIETNLTGTFLACKHVLARMVEQAAGGSIVCVTSPWAEVTAPGGASAYCASKGGISSFTRSIALDYAPFGIRVNAIVPGATETPLMWANIPPDRVPAERAKTAKQLALGRIAHPDDIAAGITWLLSDQASYVTGSHLVVDGGLMARAGIDA
jgi:NAD(P)-dependent dehydrogenase (short-subunit alcohol dehydrogenase family)